MIKRTRTKKSARKRLVALLDKKFSELIRLRDSRLTGGRCVFSCGQEIQCAFHFISRSKYATRWSEDNAVGSCTSCNYTMEFDPHPFVLWYIKKNGEKAYEALVRRSHVVAGFSTSDLEMMLGDIVLRTESLRNDSRP